MFTYPEFVQMEENIERTCVGLDESRTGVSVVLWKLRELMHGYRWALDNGYGGAKIDAAGQHL